MDGTSSCGLQNHINCNRVFLCLADINKQKTHFEVVIEKLWGKDSSLETPPLKIFLWSSAKFLQPRSEGNMLFFQNIMSMSLFFGPICRMKVGSHGSILSLFQQPLIFFFSFSKPGPLLMFCCIKCRFLRNCIRIFRNSGIYLLARISVFKSLLCLLFTVLTNCAFVCVLPLLWFLLQMILKSLKTVGAFSVVPVNLCSLGTSSIYSSQSSSR